MKLKVLDVEWSANTNDRLLTFGWGDETANPIPVAWMQELADPSIGKIAFSKSDHDWCRRHGVEVNGPFYDLQTMAWAIDERTELSLEAVAKLYGATPKDKRLSQHDGKVWFRCDDGTEVLMEDAPLEQMQRYNVQDLLTEAELFDILQARLKAEGMWDYWINHVMPYSEVLVRMEGVGLPIDIPATRRVRGQLTYGMARAQAALLSSAALPEEFKLTSPTQMMSFLYRSEFERPTRYRIDKEERTRLKAGEWLERLPLNFEPTKIGREYLAGYLRLKGLGLRPVDKAPKCAEGTCGHVEDKDHLPSTSTKTLRVHHFDNPWVRDYCEYKKKVKVLQFLDRWLEVNIDGRLFTHFNQTGTETGRLSSSDPVNLQQVPARGPLGKMVRSLFAAPPDRMFVHGDHSQIEARLMAHFSQDPALLDIFRAGKDVYEETTKAILGEYYPKGTPERDLVKMCFLAMGYGAQAKKIQRSLAETGRFFPYKVVREAHHTLMEHYHGYWSWKEGVVEQAQDDNCVYTIAGHRRHISWIDPDMRWKSANQAVNSRIQGSAAEIHAAGQTAVNRDAPWLEPVLSVHDECLWECAVGAVDERHLDRVQWCMETGHGFELTVPLLFEPRILERWSEKE